MNISATATRGAASTKDILSGFRKTKAIAPEWKRQYSRLIELRDQMISRKSHMAADAKEEQPLYSEHMGDAGTDQYDQDFALSMMSADQQAIYEIEQALGRIQDGTYGICELSGQPIEAERLEAIPWARFRFDAQKELEKDGNLARVKFGEIGKITGASVDQDDDSDDDAD